MEFQIAWGNGTIRKLMAQNKKYALLIIDEWLLYPLDETEARVLLDGVPVQASIPPVETIL